MGDETIFAGKVADQMLHRAPAGTPGPPSPWTPQSVTTMVLAIMASLGLGGFATDSFMGGAATREESTISIKVIEAAAMASVAAERDRRGAAEEERDRAIATANREHEYFMTCTAALLEASSNH